MQRGLRQEARSNIRRTEGVCKKYTISTAAKTDVSAPA
jgi:hypothetical protein